jgi:hypothetical protein
MDKRSLYLNFRLTEKENDRIEALIQRIGADRSTLARLALKRLLRHPPVRRFRHRVKRGPKL